ncbi:methyltransferase domain-containing protein [Pseudoduganella sp. FT26W]|uniref:Methyltransferase domain-containing protein n=1 Tax=Duganella aquatilis TaxID=2666082 RepID=A0A844DD97_9BURK|nr:methyltransferase domain-containing protein [Duganella aquatilis]MRW85659.1 methyltransferase domain-containing protein [Duganella aquatilis]
MANETSKQMARRSTDRRFVTRWFVGHGIDIGCGPDPLSKFADFLPLMKSLRPWDMPDGDAMVMAGVSDESYDFVHSSHCLEHLVNPIEAMKNWIRICRKGGHLVLTIPDEDLYEQGVWPSTFNSDHKWTFTIYKSASWSPRSINVLELLAAFRDTVEILKIEKLDASFHYGQPRYDQSLHTMSESGIEIVLRKRDEATAKPAASEQEAAELIAQAGQLLQQGRAEDAKTIASRAVEIAPQDTRAILALCDVYDALELFDEEIQLLEEKRSCFPAPDAVWLRQGFCHEHAGRTDAALHCFEQALALNPASALAHIYAGRQLMRKGEFSRGLREMIWMWHGKNPELGLTQQAGIFADESARSTLPGKPLLLVADSGLGDSIQFVRYARQLKAAGANVAVQVPPTLARLFQHADGVDLVSTPDSPPSGAWTTVPMHNLMCAFDTTLETIPAQTPYLRADEREAAQWRERLQDFRGLRVGLCWGGNPGFPRDRARSVPFALMARLLDQPGVTFFSLQKDADHQAPNLIDWTSELHDMAATAALVQNLDLVISVDSAVAHLAGALGREVWLLNRFDTCWRWLEERTDSPWYPNMTLFRQHAPKAWPEVMDRVSAALADLATSFERGR